jgi:hypothetical protein
MIEGNDSTMTIEVNGWADKATRLTRDEYHARWDVCTINDVQNLIFCDPAHSDTYERLAKMKSEFDAIKRSVVDSHFNDRAVNDDGQKHPLAAQL